MQQDPLSQLRDIHWPDPIGFWPLAFGYYVVLLLLIMLSCLVIYFLWGKKNRQVKKALWQEFLHIEQQYAQERDVAMLQASISALLKRMVFFKHGDKFKKSSDLLAMSEALKNMMPAKKTTELLELLAKDRFYKAPSIDGNLLLNLAREQIKRCRI